MEPFSLASLSFASLFSILPTQLSQDLQIQGNQMTITRHTSPEIAGLWELDYDAKMPQTQQNTYEIKLYSIDPQLIEAITNQSSVAILANTQIDNEDLAGMDVEGADFEKIQERMVNHIESNLKKISALTVNESITFTVPQPHNPIQTDEVCYERHNYAQDNIMWTVSGDEWTYGEYYITPMPEGLPLLSIQTLYDNNEPDCSGTQKDQTGESLHVFLDYDKQTQQMRWCLDPRGNECFMQFDKVLP